MAAGSEIVRVRAPELVPGDWLNTGHPLTLAGLRGRFVLLDFWSFCCVNCLHVIDELRGWEADRSDVLQVIGVHSPKFPHEAEVAALAAAVQRYHVTHPVLADPALALWRQYTVRAWPTLVLIDPEGYVVAQAAGEGQVSGLSALLDRLVPVYEQRGTLRRGAASVAAASGPDGALRFPAKVVLLPAARTGRDEDSLLVADAGHRQLVELALDGRTVLRSIGTREFGEPNGLTLLPSGSAPYDVLVADTSAHVLRGVRLHDGAVVATVALAEGLAGATTITGPVPDVLSPWDVTWWPAVQRVVVAAAGVHLLLALDPLTGAVSVLAGTTVEGLRDGAALDGWLAQPSGLAVDGERLWFVDAETSALRYLDVGGTLHTAVGEGLFDFGLVDGPAAVARFQHPLGVTLLPDGSLAVLDTYNGAVRRYDPVRAEVSTLARDLAEPSGGVVVAGSLVVVESAAHRLVGVGTTPAMHRAADVPERSARPVTLLRPGAVELDVAFTPPPGRTIDASLGPAVSLAVSASPPGLLVSGSGGSGTLTRRLELAAGGEGVLQVSAQVATCDDDPAVEHPACYLSRQDWGVPVRISPDGADSLELVLLE